MFAVIKTGGKQYLVEKGTKLQIEKIAGNAGDTVNFNEVLFLGETDGISLKVGKPFLSGSSVEAKVLKQGKDKKVTVIKFKRKVRYKREHGHKQQITIVEITAIK